MASTSRMNRTSVNPAEALKRVLADDSDSCSDGQEGDSDVEDSQSDVAETQCDAEESQSDGDESESENVSDDSSNGSTDNSSDSEATDKPPFFIGRSGRQWSTNPPPVSRT